jgi:hypothetical protein
MCAKSFSRFAMTAGLLAGTSLVSHAAFDTVIDNGPSSNRVDIFFLGDGYTTADLAAGTFSDHVQNYTDHVFSANLSTDPYFRYRNFFNVHQVEVVSNESGADVPQQGIEKDTALDATYQWDGVTDRLLYIDTSKANAALNSAVAGSGINAEVKFVTVNSSIYGGGGGSWAVYAGSNSNALDVALHESAHSFNSLADEYGGDATYSGSEPHQINVTADDTGNKWSRWLGYNDPTGSVVGAYESAKYHDFGLYRPTVNSKMRDLNRPFNAIGREKIILDIYDLVDPLDSFTDNSTTLVDPLTLDAEAIDDSVIDLQWFIDGVYEPTFDDLNSIDISGLGLGTGAHEVQLRAYDPTGFDPVEGWVRIETGNLEQFVGWNISVSVPEPSTWISLLLAGIVASGLQRSLLGGKLRA